MSHPLRDEAGFAVRMPEIGTSPSEPFGPTEITHWSAAGEFSERGTYLMAFTERGESQPWTLSYEESVFALQGDTWLVELSEGGERTIPLPPHRLALIPRGTTVRYGGELGARLLLSIAPVHWQDSTGSQPASDTHP